MSYAIHLKCRECERTYPLEPIAACEECWAPLEVVYDYGKLWSDLRREDLSRALPRCGGIGSCSRSRPNPTPATKPDSPRWWRLPASRRALGVRELYIKNDSVNHPTLSFKDRVVAVALSKAHEFGFDTVGCSSTGNLANAVAAQAAAGGFKTFIFVPAELEQEKIIATQVYGATLVRVQGNYDQVNRLCSEVAQKHAWGIVNVNLRSYYSEGSKTVGYEIAEQLGWRLPQNIVIPMAGGSLITKVNKAFEELKKLAWVEPMHRRASLARRRRVARPSPARPSAGPRKLIRRNRTRLPSRWPSVTRPTAPYAVKTILASGGAGEDVSDEEVVEGIRLLGETEGIFTETAGGVTVAVARKLIRQGRLNPEESTVLAITGNGLKTIGALCRGGLRRAL